MSILTAAPKRVFTALFLGNLVGAIASTIAVYLFLIYWEATGTVPPASPLSSALSLGFKLALPIGLALTVLFGVPLLALFRRFTVPLLLITLIFGFAPGLLLPASGNYYWASIILSYGVASSVLISLILYGHPQKS